MGEPETKRRNNPFWLADVTRTIATLLQNRRTEIGVRSARYVNQHTVNLLMTTGQLFTVEVKIV